MAITYELLLKLNRGAGTVVERLTPAERAGLRVRTPIISFLEELPSQTAPRHTFLTGNAGDGKTFAVQSALESWGEALDDFEVLLDASATFAEDRGPLVALAQRLEGALSAGKRLLVAINRGQLERLHSHVGEQPGGEHSRLEDVLEDAVQQLRLRVDRRDEDTSGVLVVDLGLQDVLSPAVLDPFFAALGRAEPPPASSNSARAAFLAARDSLRAESGPTRKELQRALTSLRGTGLHVTMRQLWTLGAYLLTGWRDPASERPATLEDAVIARLYSAENDSPIRAELDKGVDPALTPRPDIARLCLTGHLREALGAHEALAPLLVHDADLSGMSALRVAASTLQAPGQGQPQGQKPYFNLVEHLKGAGEPWPLLQQVSTALLNGIYMLLEYPKNGPHFPSWQYLCYESREAARATRVADREVKPTEFRVGLPRPPALAERALGDWSPPYVVLQHRDGDGTLRLPPPLFNLAFGADKSTPSISGTTRLTLSRWVTAITQFATQTSHLSLTSPGVGTSWRLERDDLTSRLTLGV